MKTEPILRLTGLKASFIQDGMPREVIHGVSFDLSQGETLGIVGESGSGKSVTSLSLMGLIPSPPISYDEGTALYGTSKVDLLRIDDEELRKLRGKHIAMIFQEPMSSLNPVMRCGEQVLEAIITHQDIGTKEAREKVIDLFGQVKLPEPERAFLSYPHQLSGGQLQRVMIAMAICNDPRVLIADEPTTALDVTIQREVIELLKGLQKEKGMAMIFITHDLHVVSQIADRLLVMKQGNIVEEGETAQVLNAPTSAYTKGLLASSPPLDVRPNRLITVSDFESNSAAKASNVSAAEREAHHRALYATEPILEVQDLHTWYPIRKGVLKKVVGHVKAVNGVGLRLHPGETLGIVGESGCGKSTLGRTIIGLESSTSGSIRYKGTPLAEMSSAEKRSYVKEVQMIFQDPYSSLNPRITIGSAITEPMQVHGLIGDSKARRAKAMELLLRVGLSEEHFGRYPHEFSGGQRQRICIARTLALEPEIVICDESVSALDVSVQSQVLNLLNELKEEFGLSYLFISHDLSVVRYMSDMVMVMNHGIVEEYGEADALYRNPSSPYTERLISSAYSLGAVES